MQSQSSFVLLRAQKKRTECTVPFCKLSIEAAEFDQNIGGNDVVKLRLRSILLLLYQIYPKKSIRFMGFLQNYRLFSLIVSYNSKLIQFGQLSFEFPFVFLFLRRRSF